MRERGLVMLKDNPILRKMVVTGEQQAQKLASQLLSNPAFMSALQTTVSRAIEAKGVLDRRLSSALTAMHVPTTHDMQRLNDRLDELERIFEGLSDKVDRISDKLDEKN